MKRLILVLFFAISANAQTDYTIMNFDKLLAGTDKLIYIEPPAGKYWLVMQGSSMTDAPVQNVTFRVWLENAPYAAYRDPETGVMEGCVRCVTIADMDANRVFFPIQGQSMPIVISYPNRLMIAFTPPHGGLPVPLMTYTRLQVVERDLP